MSGLDRAALEGVHEWARKAISRHERWERNAPLLEALQQNMERTQAEEIPDIMAGPTAQSRLSLLALEKSVAEFPLRAVEADAERESLLSAARARTAALRRWQEELS